MIRFKMGFGMRLLGGIVISAVTSATAASDDYRQLSGYEQLRRAVDEERQELVALINQSRTKGLDTSRAEVSELVVRLFQQYAQYDHDNPEEVFDNFNKFFKQKGATQPPELSAELPETELRACLEVMDNAGAELKAQLDGSIVLTPTPDLSSGTISLGRGYYLHNGKVYFPSSLIWMDKEEALVKAFGRMGGFYYGVNYLGTDGEVMSESRDEAVDSMRDQVKMNMGPQEIFLSHRIPRWMGEQYPEVKIGARNFTKYDIDNPQVRAWLDTLFKGLLPAACDASDTPRMFLLANEPHFSTKKGGWKSSALSEFSMEKYRRWLADKYKLIDRLNAVYETSYDDFADVEMTVPVDTGIRGGAVWYDWCCFNMDRVTDWFRFLKRGTQGKDPAQSPVTIKNLGFIFESPESDHGIDVEALTRMQDVTSADLKVIPAGATFYGKNEDGVAAATAWEATYAMRWRGQSMFLDFTKSLCPDKVFYDSEWHGFSTVSWRHYNLSREYVRAAIWMGFTHGMGAINPWYWGRNMDGSAKNGASMPGQLPTQPIALDAYGRTMKELNAHAERFASLIPEKRPLRILYSKDSSIQTEDYIAGVGTVYEALKLLNVPVGFVTLSDLNTLVPGEHTLIIPRTPYIKEIDLRRIQRFAANNGRILTINPEESFAFDELGRKRSPIKPMKMLSLKRLDEDIFSAADQVREVLSPLPSQGIHVEIKDENKKDTYGVLVSQSRPAENGARTIMLVNVSHADRLVRLHDGRNIQLKNLITGQPVKPSFRMKPLDVFLLEAR